MTGLVIQFHCRPTGRLLHLGRPSMTEMVMQQVTSACIVLVGPPGHNWGKILMVRLRMTAPGFPSTCRQMAILSQSGHRKMREMVMLQVMFECIVLMTPPGHNWGKILMVRHWVTIQVGQLPCRLMAIQSLSGQIQTMEMVLIQATSGCIVLVGPPGHNLGKILMARLKVTILVRQSHCLLMGRLSHLGRPTMTEMVIVQVMFSCIV